MPRGMLLIAGFAMFSAVLAQGQTVNSSTTTPVNEPFGGPLLVTPSASFPNPIPTAGISDAGRAGISDATNVGQTTAPANPGTIETEPSENLSEPTNQTPATDLGSSTSVRGPSDESATSVRGASDESARSMISLAEVSSRYKAEKGARNARVLNNEDVQAMLNNKSGVTMAKNMPPLGSGALEQGGQTQNAGSQSGTQSAQTNAPANEQGQNAASRQGGTPPPTPGGKGQSAGTGVSAENSTTPQINQNQQSNDTQGSSRLPATATLLPLLGLLGLVSGGIGFWFRKFRN